MKAQLSPDATGKSFCIIFSKVYEICRSQFRTLGLRHLVVVNNNHHVVGMVTRKDITDKTLRAYWHSQVYLYNAEYFTVLSNVIIIRLIYSN